MTLSLRLLSFSGQNFEGFRSLSFRTKVRDLVVGIIEGYVSMHTGCARYIVYFLFRRSTAASVI